MSTAGSELIHGILAIDRHIARLVQSREKMVQQLGDQLELVPGTTQSFPFGQKIVAVTKVGQKYRCVITDSVETDQREIPF